MNDKLEPTATQLEQLQICAEFGVSVGPDAAKWALQQIGRLRADMAKLHGLDVTTREGQQAFAEWRNRSMRNVRQKKDTVTDKDSPGMISAASDEPLSSVEHGVRSWR